MNKVPHRIFISGPITLGDPVVNTHKAIKVMHRLMTLGFAPLCPHLSQLAHTVRPRKYEDWMKIDLPWVEVADAVLRIPGKSKGADREVAHAKECGVPVYYDIKSLAEAKLNATIGSKV